MPGNERIDHMHRADQIPRAMGLGETCETVGPCLRRTGRSREQDGNAPFAGMARHTKPTIIFPKPHVDDDQIDIPFRHHFPCSGNPIDGRRHDIAGPLQGMFVVKRDQGLILDDEN